MDIDDIIISLPIISLPTLDYDIVLDLNTGYGGVIIKRGSDLRYHGLDAPNRAYIMSRCKPYLVDKLIKQGYILLAKYKNFKNEDGFLIGIPIPEDVKSDQNAPIL